MITKTICAAAAKPSKLEVLTTNFLTVSGVSMSQSDINLILILIRAE